MRAIYAGTFDPLTNGHYDVIQRAAKIFDEVLLAIGKNSKKHPMFPLVDRFEMAEEVVRTLDNVIVTTFEGLLVEYARKMGAKILVRGLRMYSDFEYEFQMALTNRKLNPDIESVFLMPSEKYSYVSSSSVRELINVGGNYSYFVPESVRKHIENKYMGHK